MTVIPYIIPLTSVPGLLIQAIGTSGSYRSMAEQLLAQTWRLDAHLCQAIEAQPTAGGADYFLNMNLVDYEESRRIFEEIRQHKDEIDARYTLLGHAAALIDYVSHTTTNILTLSPIKQRLLASVADPGVTVEYAGVEGPSFEWSTAIYMGLSPYPIFGANIRYEDEGLALSLRRFGLGIATYLTLSLRPEIAHSRQVPAEIDQAGVDRPVARRPLEILPDGSIVL